MICKTIANKCAKGRRNVIKQSEQMKIVQLNISNCIAVLGEACKPDTLACGTCPSTLPASKNTRPADNLCRRKPPQKHLRGTPHALHQILCQNSENLIFRKYKGTRQMCFFPARALSWVGDRCKVFKRNVQYKTIAKPPYRPPGISPQCQSAEPSP